MGENGAAGVGRQCGLARRVLVGLGTGVVAVRVLVLPRSGLDAPQRLPGDALQSRLRPQRLRLLARRVGCKTGVEADGVEVARVERGAGRERRLADRPAHGHRRRAALEPGALGGGLGGELVGQRLERGDCLAARFRIRRRDGVACVSDSDPCRGVAHRQSVRAAADRAAPTCTVALTQRSRQPGLRLHVDHSADGIGPILGGGWPAQQFDAHDFRQRNREIAQEVPGHRIVEADAVDQQQDAVERRPADGEVALNAERTAAQHLGPGQPAQQLVDRRDGQRGDLGRRHDANRLADRPRALWQPRRRHDDAVGQSDGRRLSTGRQGAGEEEKRQQKAHRERCGGSAEATPHGREAG